MIAGLEPRLSALKGEEIGHVDSSFLLSDKHAYALSQETNPK